MGGRRLRMPLIIGTVALTALHLVLSHRITGPWVTPDEIGYLGNARWLVGDHRWPVPPAPAYAVGYPIILAPIMAAVHDPALRWRLVELVNAVLLASLFPLVHTVLHRVLAVPARRALAAAAVAALIPAALATSYSAVSENLTLPLTAASVLAAWAMARHDARFGARIWLGPAVGVLYAAHPRFALCLPAAAAVIVASVIAGYVTRRVAAANLLAMVGVAAGAVALNRAVQDARWVRVVRPEGDLGSFRDLIGSVDGLRELATTAAGQAWYLLAGTFGLVAIGVAVAVVHVRRPGPLDDPPGTQPAADRQDHRAAQRVALAWLLAAAACVFVTSSVFFAQNQFRLDHYVYGRHNDTFTPLWLGMAVAWLTGARPLRTRLRAVALAAVPLAVTGLIVIHERDPGDFEGRVSSFSVPALLYLLKQHPSRAFTFVTVAALVGVAVVAGLLALDALPGRRSRARLIGRTALVLALGLWFVGLGRDNARRATGFDRVQYETWHAPRDITALGIRDLWMDQNLIAGHPHLTYPWALPEVTFHLYDPATAEPAGPFTLALLDDPARRAAGDRIALLDGGFRYQIWSEDRGLAVWVAPGPDQDRLARQGRLLPSGFPETPLPRAARSARVRLIDPPAAPVEVTAGGHVDLRVALAHTGRGSPWPDRASFELPGRVRLVTLITPLDPGGLRGARSGGELTRWMVPGDRDDVSVKVFALGELLQPLPPGRYRVELALAQDGGSWTTPGGPEATFQMVVR